MNAAPLVSVIVPVYNVAAYLPQCLDSLVNQTLKDIEIICINDGSTDDSQIVLEDYARHHKNIIILQQENQGQSVAKNWGLQVAKGQYFGFVDGDDWVREDMFRLLYEVASPIQLDIAMCMVLSYSEKKKAFFEDKFFSEKPIKSQHRKLFSIKNAKKEVFYLPAICCDKIYSRRFWISHGFMFPVGLKYEDIYTFVASITRASRMGVVDYQGYIYRRDRTGSTVNTPDRKIFDIFPISAMIINDMADHSLWEELKGYLAHFLFHRQYRFLQSMYHSLRAEMFDEILSFWTSKDAKLQEMLRAAPLVCKQLDQMRKRGFRRWAIKNNIRTSLITVLRYAELEQLVWNILVKARLHRSVYHHRMVSDHTC